MTAHAPRSLQGGCSSLSAAWMLLAIPVVPVRRPPLSQLSVSHYMGSVMWGKKGQDFYSAHPVTEAQGGSGVRFQSR